jgi:hypothetical protein
MSNSSRWTAIRIAFCLITLITLALTPTLAGAADGSITYMSGGSVYYTDSNIPIGNMTDLQPLPAGAVAWSYLAPGDTYPTAYMWWDITTRPIEVTGDMTLTAVFQGWNAETNYNWTVYTDFTFGLSGSAGNTPETIPYEQYQAAPFNVTGTITWLNYHQSPNHFSAQIPVGHYFYFPPDDEWVNGTSLIPLTVNVELTRSGEAPVMLNDTGEVIYSWVDRSWYNNGSISGLSILPSEQRVLMPPAIWSSNGYSVYRLGPRITYTVAYLPGDHGTWSNDAFVTSGLIAGEATPVAPTGAQLTHQSGYTFVGWQPNWNATVNGNVDYVAQWRQDEYTVTYDPGTQGTWTSGDVGYVFSGLHYNDATPEPASTPHNPGYTFAGWSPTWSSVVTGSVTYVAQWTRNEYTVTFVPGPDGAFVAAVHGGLFYGDPTPTPPVPTPKPGYTFVKWEPALDPTVTGDVTYEAIFEKTPDGGGSSGGGSKPPVTGDVLSLAFLPALGISISALATFAARKKRHHIDYR